MAMEGATSSWWNDPILYSLSAVYALVSAVALIQLIRIELRTHEYGWSMQKVFHLMNFIVNGVRAIVFGLHNQVFLLQSKLLLELPVLLFFSTYTLLVLFWAEIYHEARNPPTDKLRLAYTSINSVVYFIQENLVDNLLVVCIWIYMGVNDNSVVEFIGKFFITVLSLVAAVGFFIYGGRLLVMLKRFPIDSKGRKRKLQEVGSVTVICCTCFLIRSFVVALSAFDADTSLDVSDHPLRNLIYYLSVEIVPSALVLYILRKLPPKRMSDRSR